MLEYTVDGNLLIQYAASVVLPNVKREDISSAYPRVMIVQTPQRRHTVTIKNFFVVDEQGQHSDLVLMDDGETGTAVAGR